MNKLSKQVIEACDESMSMCEMANAYHKDTGLKGTLYFSKHDEQQVNHNLGRVKYYADGEEVFTSIKTKSDGSRISGIRGNSNKAHKVLKDLEEFVVKNEELLWTYWESSINDKLTSDNVKKQFKKV